MSQRNKPRSQAGNSAIAWPVVALGVILIVAAIFFLLARQNGSDGTPRVTVEPKQIDYGYVKFGETRDFAVSVTNTGDGPLRFAEKPYIEVLEGC